MLKPVTKCSQVHLLDYNVEVLVLYSSISILEANKVAYFLLHNNIIDNLNHWLLCRLRAAAGHIF